MAVCSRVPRKRYTDQVNQQSTLENNEQMQDQEKKVESQQQKLIDLEQKTKDLEEAREPKQVHCITINTILLLGFLACLTSLAVYKYQELQQQYLELQQQYQELHQQHHELHQQHQELHQQHMEDIKSIARQQQETERKVLFLINGVAQYEAVDYGHTARWKFEMKNCSIVMKYKNGRWTSPAMYTHANGYKFNIVIVISITSIWAGIDGVPGEFDSLLEWPARAKFTLQLVSHNKSNVTVSSPMTTWLKTNSFAQICHFYLVRQTRARDFLYNDTLKFMVNVLLP